MAKEKVTILYGDEESVKARFNSLVSDLKDGGKLLTYDEKTFFVTDYRALHGKFSNIRECPDMIYKYCSGMNYEYCNKVGKRAISGEQFEIFKQKCQLFYKNFKNISIHRGHGEYVTITPDLHLKAVSKLDGKECASLSMADEVAFYFLCWLQYVKFLQYIGKKCDGPLVIYGLTEFLDIYFPIEDLFKEALSAGKKVYLFDTCENTKERFAKLDKLVNLVKVRYCYYLTQNMFVNDIQ